MAVLGPLDRRTARKRCVNCTRRKIKCEGGRPCQYCTKKKQKCAPQEARAKTDLVFVHISEPSKGQDNLSKVDHLSALKLCPSIPEDKLSLFTKHFFSDFLVRNDFGTGLDFGTIVSQFQKTPSLYHATIAVGALDLSKKQLVSSARGGKDAAVAPFVAYHTSISEFQNEIVSKSLLLNDVNLWTTFFLGIFELMHDMTGEGWVKHILYGTSKILQLRGPNAHLTGPGQSFFLTVRVFEICRALIYSEPTFLCQPEWMSLTANIWSKDAQAWHPKEYLFDLMIKCSSLSHRVWDILKPDSKYPDSLLSKALLEFAAEGLITRSALDNWFVNLKEWSIDTAKPEHSLQSTLATIYFHAISIYLSGIFDYRCQFIDIITPTISQAAVQGHVDVILAKTQTALRTSNLGPVLFFFPLRVAGARVTSLPETESILAMLREISRRSFVVADAFTTDLKSLWQHKGIQYFQ